MSIDVQKQIRENATDISSFRTDISRWADELGKEEVRREKRRRAAGQPAAASVSSAVSASSSGTRGPTENEACAMAAMSAIASAAGVKVDPGVVEEKEKQAPEAQDTAEPIRRDGTQMHQYYSSWDQFDVDGELDRLDEVALEQQRREREQRQAEKDKILDELALKPDGDRSRTSKARPRVKIAVRASGRRVAPVDLAEPKRKEANGYFSAGRFRESIAMYSSALDLLEKYEPPDASSQPPRAAENGAAGGEEVQAPVTADETEALQLKTTLLANRAAALLKLEEWRHVVDDCTEALRFDAKHAKATFRRGLAYARLKVWGKAAKDLERTVEWEPGDKKASAELQMVRRMLAEQTKEARDRARRVMIDPTRQPSMPTRRLTVRVQRNAYGGGADAAALAGAPAAPAPRTSQLDGLDDDSPGGGAPSTDVAAAAAGQAAAERRPYVPRSVRMRGRQPSAVQAAMEAQQQQQPRDGAADAASRGSGGVGAAPGPAQMNFYTFEGLWARHRSRPSERLALLERIGAKALPALFRESLDSELLASIVEVLAGTLPDAQAAAERPRPAFAADVIAALSRTPRFDVSCQGLTSQERSACRSLVNALADRGALSGDRQQELLAAYEDPRRPAATAAEEDSDEPPEEEAGPAAPAAPAPPVAKPPAEAATAPAAPAEQAPPVAKPSAPAEVVVAPSFAVDDLD